MMQKIRSYLIIWLGQTASVLGTSMTTFAMTIWAWDKTSQATPLAFIVATGLVTYLLLTPIAGVVVDRYDRKWVMLSADLGPGWYLYSSICCMPMAGWRSGIST